VGDEVFGDIEGGAFAEYVAVGADSLVARPSNLGLVESSTLGVAALTALQGLRDWGRLEAGQSVLINGASGGVGTFAIQIARALGASHVTAVCSTPNVEIARELGADRVVDYTRDDFSTSGEKFDLLFDNAGSWSLTACRRLLTQKGIFVMVTGQKGQWVAPVGRLIAGRMRAMAWTQSIANDVAEADRGDLEVLKEMVESGSVRPVIDRRFSLDEAIEALEYQSQGHARGKSVVIP
jgi:NADPH:quinone reductase-like Zn-dependent oxidoreductase